MKKKKIHFIFIIVSLFLIIGCISLNINTVTYAKDRITTEINNTPIKTESETIQESSALESNKAFVIEKDESNKYQKAELIIVIVTTIIVIICLINLIITKFGTISIVDSLRTSKRLIYYSMILVVLCTTASIYNVMATDKKILNGVDMKTKDNKSIAVLEITKASNTSSLTETSTKTDTSVIQISNNATYIASNLELLKSSGQTTDKTSSLYYGLNSVLIAKDGSTAELKNSVIVSVVDYSSGIFVNGLGTTMSLDNITINTNKEYSNGIVATKSGNVNATNMEITTKGDNSNSVKTLSSDSEITVADSRFVTEGQNSPLIYTKGKVVLTNIEGTSKKSSIITMNGINSTSINDSTLLTNLDTTEENIAAINLYTETSKYDRMTYNNASLDIENSTLTISKTSQIYKTAPMFYITNIDTNINISNSKLNYGSDILFKITGNDKYGEIGDNGGNVIFTSTDQALKGNIIIDKSSSITMNLNNTYYKGCVNSNNESKQVNIVLDKTAKWELTGDSYITTLTIQNGKISRLKRQIDSNGYDIYYNVNQNEWLNGATIKLPGGGKLIPVDES